MSELIELSNRYGRAVIDPYGGQGSSYYPPSGQQVFWMTSMAWANTAKAAGQPVRGGVPVCWPLFGPDPKKEMAQHGFARTSTWRRVWGDRDRAALVLETNGSEPGFPHQVELTEEVELDGMGLLLRLISTNLGDEVVPLSVAFHPYFMVGDVAQVKVLGLEGTTVKGTSGDGVTQFGAKRIAGEVDDLHTAARSPVLGPVMLVDPVMERQIAVSATGHDAWMVWNPGREKAEAKPEMAGGAYCKFVCIEPVSRNVLLQPARKAGCTHTLEMRVQVLPLAA